MKLTKEDYMRLPKERLAELLVEYDKTFAPIFVPPVPTITTRQRICWDGTICAWPEALCSLCIKGSSTITTTNKMDDE